MQETVICANGRYDALDSWFAVNRIKRPMLVCGKSIHRLAINRYLETLSDRLGVRVVRFTDFQPNPLYENVVAGVKMFRAEGCDAILAIGGGSAMDVAKCIKLFCAMPGDGENGSYLRQTVQPNALPFLAMPTTSGSGSEATRFAVIYDAGKKQSISDPGCIPGTVLLDGGVLKTLPAYQKKATMMDALCHAIESFWSVNSTGESKLYSRDAIRGVLEHMEGYLSNTDRGNAGMLMAANTAGKAINITQTTAGHAMCYKITGLFGCAHGHAAILCDRVLFPWMLRNTDGCIDPRGAAYLRKTLDEIGQAMGCDSAEAGAEKLRKLFDSLKLEVPAATKAQLEELKTSVNPERLRNHPVALDPDTIDSLYHEILRC